MGEGSATHVEAEQSAPPLCFDPELTKNRF